MSEKLLHDAHAIFCEVFHSSMPYETFRHKHLGNPNIDPNISTLLNYQDGVPAGTNSFMSYILLDGIQAMPITHSCDTAVRPDFRGRRIFSLLIEQAISICRETPNALILATPNQNSYPGFVKLGFQELGKLDSYAAVTRPAHLLLRKVLGRASSLPPFKAETSRDGTWTLSLRCPFTEEDLTVINNHFDIHIQRSLPFYQWKIDYLPIGEAAYLCARQGGHLSAFLILRRFADGSCQLCDWMLPEEGSASRALLKSALHLLRPYCDLVNVPMVNPEGKDPGQLADGGFIKKKSWPCPFLIYPTGDLEEETLSRLKDIRNWTLRHIDADTVLNG